MQQQPAKSGSWAEPGQGALGLEHSCLAWPPLLPQTGRLQRCCQGSRWPVPSTAPHEVAHVRCAVPTALFCCCSCLAPSLYGVQPLGLTLPRDSKVSLPKGFVQTHTIVMSAQVMGRPCQMRYRTQDSHSTELSGFAFLSVCPIFKQKTLGGPGQFLDSDVYYPWTGQKGGEGRSPRE